MNDLSLLHESGPLSYGLPWDAISSTVGPTVKDRGIGYQFR